MSNLVGGMPAGAVDLGGSAQAASAGYPVGAIHFGPAPSSLWEEQPSLRELYDQACQGLVRAECEADELRAEVALAEAERIEMAKMLRSEREMHAACQNERDDARAMLEARWHEQDPPLVQMMNERDKARDTVLRLRKQRAIARNFGEQMERERDLLRVQAQAGEQLGLALVKTIDELKAEKAAIFAQLVSLQAGSRRATLDEIAESVREKYEPEHEGEGMDNG